MIDDFVELLRFKTISAEPNNPEMQRCVEWLQRYLQKIGFRTEIWPTATYPALFGELHVDDNAPTLLFYNHYDVQPVDPLHEWKSDPFSPRIDGDTLYARGAQDNKGQLYYVLAALKEFPQPFPVNIKIIIEGDEEMGSTGLKDILPSKRAQLQADTVLVTDLSIDALDKPSITLGTRGLLCMELSLRGSKLDLHSGEHGGVVFNPLHALVQILAQLRGPDGRITVPGFYDHVEPPAIDLPFDAQGLERDFHALPTGGEGKYPPGIRGTLRPTLEINGISGGYAGPGFKTVIPARAIAKLSCRLVAGQEPSHIFNQIAEEISRLTPEGIETKLERIGFACCAASTSSHSPAAQSVKKAYTQVFGTPCEEIYSGASIGLIQPLQEASGATVILHGVGLNTDCIHAPNEHFTLSRLELGKKLITEIIRRSV